jgi:hypothetical protein
MAKETYFVVQVFAMKRGYLMPCQAYEASDRERALALADRLSLSHPAVLAFSRTWNCDIDSFADAVIIAQYGTIPEEALDAMAA